VARGRPSTAGGRRTALAAARWHRGSRAKLGGGAWQAEEVPARGGWVQKHVEVPREAKAKLELAYGRPRAVARGVAPSVGGGREQRSWRKGKRTQTKFPKTPGTKL